MGNKQQTSYKPDDLNNIHERLRLFANTVNNNDEIIHTRIDSMEAAVNKNFNKVHSIMDKLNRALYNLSSEHIKLTDLYNTEKIKNDKLNERITLLENQINKSTV